MEISAYWLWKVHVAERFWGKTKAVIFYRMHPYMKLHFIENGLDDLTWWNWRHPKLSYFYYYNEGLQKKNSRDVNDKVVAENV